MDRGPAQGKGSRGGGRARGRSPANVHALARADLVDEYHLYQHPVLLGGGKLLFPAGHGRQNLDLTRLTRYDNGVVALTYERKDGAR